MSVRHAVERVYQRFATYPCPAGLSVCEQCGPQFSGRDIAATPLRTLSLPQLVAVHVMSLDDDALRHFVPRLLELMVHTPSPVFDFRLADLKARLPAWRPEETAAVADLAEAVWSELVAGYPGASGYFADCPSALDFLDWCDLPLGPHLDSLLTVGDQPAARHLADLVGAVLTSRRPFETASTPTVLDWLRRSAVGDRLQEAFFAADSDEAAGQLAAAHELWTVSGR